MYCKKSWNIWIANWTIGRLGKLEKDKTFADPMTEMGQTLDQDKPLKDKPFKLTTHKKTTLGWTDPKLDGSLHIV